MAIKFITQFTILTQIVTCGLFYKIAIYLMKRISQNQLQKL